MSNSKYFLVNNKCKSFKIDSILLIYPINYEAISGSLCFKYLILKIIGFINLEMSQIKPNLKVSSSLLILICYVYVRS